MEEILKVELIRSFSLLYDIIIPIGIAIITGVVVGFAVGFVLRRRRLKDAMEEEIRKDRLRIIEKLILYLKEYTKIAQTIILKMLFLRPFSFLCTTLLG